MIDPDRLSVQRGGGCLMLVGLPFFGFGIFAIYSLLVPDSDPERTGGLILSAVGFTAVGGALIFGRVGVVIDRRAREVYWWAGPLFPLLKRSRPIDEIQSVTLKREVRRSKNSTYTVYPVRLEGPETPVTVEEPRDYTAARRRAEQAAKVLRLDLRDSTSGEEIVRAYDTLDESLRERLKRTGEILEMPEAPPESLTKLTLAGDSAAFELQPLGFGLVEVILLVFAGASLIGLAIGAIIFTTQMLPSVADDTKARSIFMVMGAVFGLIGLAVPIGFTVAAIRLGTARQRVTVSPGVLRLETITKFGTKTVEIPTDELEELGLGRPDKRRPFMPGRTVIARSDKVSLEIGPGLPEREQQWLCDVIKYVVTAEKR